MFITHSIIPFLILFLIAILSWNFLIFIYSLSYLFHIIIDTIDWGANILYIPKRLVGPKILITEEESKEIEQLLLNYKIPFSFFNFRYYKNKTILSLELLIFVLMILSMIVFALEYMYFTIFYLLAIFFHIVIHNRLKKIESI